MHARFHWISLVYMLSLVVQTKQLISTLE